MRFELRSIAQINPLRLYANKAHQIALALASYLFICRGATFFQRNQSLSPALLMLRPHNSQMFDSSPLFSIY
jgi:hypothetical protein